MPGCEFPGLLPLFEAAADALPLALVLLLDPPPPDSLWCGGEEPPLDVLVCCCCCGGAGFATAEFGFGVGNPESWYQ